MRNLKSFEQDSFILTWQVVFIVKNVKHLMVSKLESLMWRRKKVIQGVKKFDEIHIAPWK